MDSMAVASDREILYIPVDKIMPNPYQPRRFFDSSGLTELAKSILEHGVIQPISVRRLNDYSYELVSGERRLRASILAGFDYIPAIIVNINDEESAVIALIENIQRQNLNYLEEAEGFLNLMHDYSITQEELAVKLGKSQSTIANKIRILKLPKIIQKKLVENELTERHARALLRLENLEQQLEAVHKIVEDGLTVKRTEALVEQMLKPPKQVQKMKRCLSDIRIFTNTIRQAVDSMNNSGMSTEYLVEELDSGCEIIIRIEY